jgi:hypothetical protein
LIRRLKIFGNKFIELCFGIKCDFIFDLGIFLEGKKLVDFIFLQILVARNILL